MDTASRECWICTGTPGATLNGVLHNGSDYMVINRCEECEQLASNRNAEEMVLRTPGMLATLFKRNNSPAVERVPLLIYSQDPLDLVTAKVVLGIKVERATK
jgi:hypothetical protein